jgi:ankyrin repeat protein
MEGNQESVRVLLDHGVDISTEKADEVTTALTITAERGKEPVVRLLLAFVPEKGIHIENWHCTCSVALEKARKNGYGTIAKLLTKTLKEYSSLI